ncbi:MAG: cadherin-like beta sandwich domain-containing protein [Ruminococcaceae bacterium]|nr:cadherin-like beta sandwich domain-containing protein [Oscillospiraceae bacterium]
MMKRLTSIFLCFVVLLSLLTFPADAAKYSVSVSGSKNVVVGNEYVLKITLSGDTAFTGWSMVVNYEQSELKYVSGADGEGGGGAVQLLNESGGEGITSKTFSIRFKARRITKNGTKISVSDVFVTPKTADNEMPTKVSVSGSSCTLNIVAAPDLSGENHLSALSVSTGDLNPAFTTDTTNYSVSVPYETTSVAVYATAKDGKAKVSVTPSDALLVGENKVSVVVTAEDGSERTYTITVTREASELSGVTVNMDDAVYDVAYDPLMLAVPVGYVATTALYEGKKILVFASPKETLQIAYLSNENEGAWYIYDPVEQTFSEFRQITGAANSVVLLTPEKDVRIPAGFLPHEITVGETVWQVYKANNSEAAKIWLVYGMNDQGECGFYYYDEKLATFSSFFKPSEDTSVQEKALKDVAAFKSLYEESQKKSDRMEILFLIAAVIAALLLTGLILVLVLKKKKTSTEDHTEDEENSEEAESVETEATEETVPAPEKEISPKDLFVPHVPFPEENGPVSTISEPASDAPTVEISAPPVEEEKPSVEFGATARDLPKRRRAKRTLDGIGRGESIPAETEPKAEELAPTTEPVAEESKEKEKTNNPFSGPDMPTILR